MEDKVFVALDDWQLTCCNLEELIDTITALSSRPYVVASLLEEMKLVVGFESGDWDKVRQLGFTNRDEAQAAYYAECKRRNIKS